MTQCEYGWARILARLNTRTFAASKIAVAPSVASAFGSAP